MLCSQKENVIMCGRSSLSKTEVEIEKRFKATFYSDELEKYNPIPSYNVAPSHYHPIITNVEKDKIHLYRWGLIPSWAKDEKIGFKMINARVETLLEKKSFKKAVSNQRCIVPFDGFYEWRKEGRKKIPYRFTTKDQEIFSIAGLWDRWISEKGESIYSFTIITQEANDIVGQIHNRMPAILNEQQEAIWLDNDIHPKELIQIIGPYPNELMEKYRVNEDVNNVRNNNVSLFEPFALKKGENLSLF